MMRRWSSLTLVAAMLVAVPRAGTAQSAPHAEAAPAGGSAVFVTTVGGSAGVALPLSDLAAFASTGYTVTLALGLRQPASPLAFRFEGLFDEFAWKDAPGLRRRVVAGIANGVYDLATSAAAAQTGGRLYLIGGLGLYGSHDTDASGGGATSTSPGVNAGAGYRLALSGFDAYVEARYHAIMSTPGQQIVPVTFGISF